VRTEKGIEKHVMRYPQIFATKAIERALIDAIRKGIIWHTQGSGKTAYAEKMMTRLIIEQLKNKHELPLTAEGCRFINNLIIKEYVAESQGQHPA
jgi:type I site-specific restriction-modification system R (restriction) subunit